MNAQPYITSLWLILYLPKMAYLYVRENWKMLATAAAVLGALTLISYSLGSKSGTATETPENDGFADLTAAFATGEKRTMEVELIAIHHTAGNPDGNVNDICKVHFGEHRWNGVGYHYFIDHSGKVYQLRPLSKLLLHYH